jgi:hypothetical protein
MLSTVCRTDALPWHSLHPGLLNSICSVHMCLAGIWTKMFSDSLHTSRPACCHSMHGERPQAPWNPSISNNHYAVRPMHGTADRRAPTAIVTFVVARTKFPPSTLGWGLLRMARLHLQPRTHASCADPPETEPRLVCVWPLEYTATRFLRSKTAPLVAYVLFWVSMIRVKDLFGPYVWNPRVWQLG